MPTKPEYPPTLNVARAASLGLVGAWLSHKGSGIYAYDSSGNAKHATIVGGVAWTTGGFDGALHYNGSNGYGALGYHAVHNPNYMSIIAWVKPDIAGVKKQIFSKDDSVGVFFRSWQFRTFTTGAVSFIVFKDNTTYGVATGSTVVPTGSYHQLVGTYDGANVKVYYDSVIEDTAPLAGTVNAQTNDVFIGKAETADPGYFDGVIDHVLLFNKALDQTEIDTMFADPFWMYRAEARPKVGACRRPVFETE